MKQFIKDILTKHGYPLKFDDQHPFDQAINNAIIEICEEQKKGCQGKWLAEEVNKIILNSKNIAE